MDAWFAHLGATLLLLNALAQLGMLLHDVGLPLQEKWVVIFPGVHLLELLQGLEVGELGLHGNTSRRDAVVTYRGVFIVYLALYLSGRSNALRGYMLDTLKYTVNST